MSLTKRMTRLWASRLAIASIAIVAGCSSGLSTSSSNHANPSIQTVQNGAHPLRVTPPTLAAPSTTVPPSTTIPTRHVAAPPTTEPPPPPPPPTTFVHLVAPPTTVTTRPPAPPSAPASQSALGNPSSSMPPDPDFFGVCSSSSLDLTGACEQEALQAIDPRELQSISGRWSFHRTGQLLRQLSSSSSRRTSNEPHGAFLLSRAWRRCSSRPLKQERTVVLIQCPLEVSRATIGRAMPARVSPLLSGRCIRGCTTTGPTRPMQTANPVISKDAGVTATTS